MIRATIDVGSNSLLLLVQENKNGQWSTLYESSAVTALGHDTKQTGLLSETSMEETLKALKQAYTVAQNFGATEIMAAGTMALRMAKNAQTFLDLAQQQGTPVFILSGEEEAALGFLAVALDPKFCKHKAIAIIDPGAQSTELVIAEKNPETKSWKLLFERSFPVGALGLKSEMFQEESLTPGARLRAVQEIDQLLEAAGIPKVCGEVFVLGATGTNLVAIREKLVCWDPKKVHGQVLNYEEISRAVDWMMGMNDQERSQIVGLEKGRERTIHIGCLILERFLHALRKESCIVSTRGWRHALLENRLSEHSLTKEFLKKECYL